MSLKHLPVLYDEAAVNDYVAEQVRIASFASGQRSRAREALYETEPLALPD